MLRFFLIISLFFTFSCSYKPILDENFKYKNTSQDRIEYDIQNCEKKAKNHLKGIKARRAAKEGVRKGIFGAIIGAIFGIFTGNVGQVAKSAGVGAAVGAGVGATSVAAEGSLTNDQIKQRYISNCLARKGYSVIGWE